MATAELSLIYEETKAPIEDCIYRLQDLWKRAARKDPSVERLSDENQHQLDTWAAKALVFASNHLDTRMGLEAGDGTFFPRQPYEAILKCFKDLKQHATHRIPFEDLLATLRVALEYCEIIVDLWTPVVAQASQDQDEIAEVALDEVLRQDQHREVCDFLVDIGNKLPRTWISFNKSNREALLQEARKLSGECRGQSALNRLGSILLANKDFAIAHAADQAGSWPDLYLRLIGQILASKPHHPTEHARSLATISPRKREFYRLSTSAL